MQRMVVTVTTAAIFAALSPLAQAQQIQSSSTVQRRGVQVSDEAIGAQYGHMLLAKTASDPQYGYSPESPVRVGGGFSKGAHNTYRFLNSLLGPHGEKVHCKRVGTCCPFKTPNSPFGDTALLEVYEVTHEGASAAKRLYFNWYDPGEPLVPMGLTTITK